MSYRTINICAASLTTGGYNGQYHHECQHHDRQWVWNEHRCGSHDGWRFFEYRHEYDGE